MCCVQAETDVGAAFMVKKDEILKSWGSSHDQWLDLASTMGDIKPRMKTLDEVHETRTHGTPNCRRVLMFSPLLSLWRVV